MKKEKARNNRKWLNKVDKDDHEQYVSWYVTGDINWMDAEFRLHDGDRTVSIAMYGVGKKGKTHASNIDMIIQQLQEYKKALGEVYAVQPSEAEIRYYPWEE